MEGGGGSSRLQVACVPVCLRSHVARRFTLYPRNKGQRHRGLAGWLAGWLPYRGRFLHLRGRPRRGNQQERAETLEHDPETVTSCRPMGKKGSKNNSVLAQAEKGKAGDAHHFARRPARPALWPLCAHAPRQGRTGQSSRLPRQRGWEQGVVVESEKGSAWWS